MFYSPPVFFLLTVSRILFVICVSCLSVTLAVMSVPCLERDDLLALLYVVTGCFPVFVTFPYMVSWVIMGICLLIVSIHDLCLLPFIYRKMEYFRVAKFSRFPLKNMRINIRGLLYPRKL